MKRMNLIRIALFAVFAFMGTLSLSAQQTWLPPASAAIVIMNELDQLNEPPVINPPASGMQPLAGLLDEHTKSSGCTDCALRAVKIQFLLGTMKNIKEGMDTGPAVEDTRAFLINASGNNAELLNTIQKAYQYMDSIL